MRRIMCAKAYAAGLSRMLAYVKFRILKAPHALGKDVILITQDGRDVPFDLAHLRHIRYLANGEGLKQLETELSARIATLLSDRGR